MSFIKSLFGSKEPAPRKISQVNQLNTGDVIVFSDSFGLPELLRGQQFQISSVNSYEYEHATETEWVLTGTTNTELFLSLEQDDKTYLKLSLKLDRSDVESLFDLDQFATVFDEPGQAELAKQQDSDLTSQWSSDGYRQHTFAKVGYFHRKDHRSNTLSQYEGKDAGEQFELYALIDDSDDKGVEIEVWQDGDTDVFLTLYRPTSDIVDMFPGS